MDNRSQTSKENGKKGGRPKGSKNPETIQREIVQKEYRERMVKKLIPLIEAQLELALGIHVATTRKGKKFLLYKKEPDGKAIEDILNRVLGKAKIDSDESAEGLSALGEAVARILSVKKVKK